MRVNPMPCKVTGCTWVGLTVRRGWCPKHYKRWVSTGDPTGLRRRENGAEPYASIIFYGWDRYGLEECLLYRGAVNGLGYGNVSDGGGSSVSAHRVAYEKWHGPVPVGMVLDHECHNRAALRGECDGGSGCVHRRCVNPGHLAPVTPEQNFLKSPLTAAGGGGSAGARFNSAKTHCPQGHAYDRANTFIHHGSRECRTCVNARARMVRSGR